MLSRIHRLPALDIPLVMKRGTRVIGHGVTVIYRSNSQTKIPRFAFIASTKVDKRAAVRNRVRRILQEIVRLNMDVFHQDSDHVIIIQKSATTMARDQIEKQLLSFLN